MIMKQAVIHFGTVLLFVSVLVQGFIFGGPEGELLPNNPKKCTGENITFTCKADEYSSSTLRFKLNDNDPIPDNETIVVDNSKRSMTLTDLTMADHHLNILCCMNNCIESSDIVGSTQILQMYEYPTSVVNFSCVRFGWSNEMSCTYDLGQVYRELPNVVVRWSMPALSGSWNDCPVFNTVSKSECRWNAQSVSDRHIKIEIDITSQCGVSIPEQLFEVNTSLIVKPHPLPEIRVLAVNSTCIQAAWDNPVFNQLKQYRIEISSHWSKNGSEDIEPYYEVETMDTRKNESTYVFCDLVPNTKYNVTGYIKPAIEGYWSEVKVAPEVMTPKDIPFYSPHIIEGAYKWDPAQCEADGKRTIYLYFNPIPAQYRNGEMKAVVARGDPPFRQLKLTNKTEIPADHTQLGVEVNCDTDYNFFINGRNEMGESDNVSKIFVPKASSRHKVPKLIIETLDQKIYLNWSAEISKNMTGFTLFWCKKYRGNCQTNATIHWKKLPGNSDTAILDIHSPEDYLYSVSMETQQGSTGMTWESCIYARYAEPQQHPETPTVSRSSEDNTLAVYWNKIECESGTPYIVSYKVLYCIWAKHANNCSGERSELIVPSTQTSVVLEGLNEDQKYGVIIQGLTADGQESPHSDPAFGTPENNSLKTGAIIGIAIGCICGFVIMLAGIIAIVRYCRKKAEQRLSLYPIKDVVKETAPDKNLNGYSNQVYSGYELPDEVTVGNGNYTDLDSVYTPNGNLPQLPPRPERQESKDSGIPDDPLTPRNTDERLQFPSTIDEQKPATPLTPDGNFDIKWHMNLLPNGYTRVNTDDDNIPRISVHPNSSDDTDHAPPAAPQNLMDNQYIPNGLVGSMTIVPQPNLIVMTALQSQNQITIPRSEARDMNTAEAEESGQSPVTSYLKATMVLTEEVTDQETSSVATSSNNGGYVSHSANTTDYVSNGSIAAPNSDNSRSHPNSLVTLTNTGGYVSQSEMLPTTATDYVPHHNTASPDYDNRSRSNSAAAPGNTGGYISHSQIYAANSTDHVSQSNVGTPNPDNSRSHPSSVATHANTGGYISHSEMQPANTTDNVSEGNIPTQNSSNNKSHANSVASSSDTGSYVSHSQTHSSNSTDYVSQDTIASSTFDNSRSHPTLVGTPAKVDSYISQSEIHPNDTNNYVPHGSIATSNSGNNGSHLDSVTILANTGGYVSQSDVQPASTTDYVSHDSVATPYFGNNRAHSNSVATPGNTDGYASHSEIQPASITDYVSHDNIATLNSGNNRSHPNSVNRLADSDITSENETDTKITGYISHEVAQTASINNPVSNSYIKTSSSDTNISHANVVASVYGSHIQQADAVLGSTGAYLPHTDDAVKNNAYEPQSNLAIDNASGYVSLGNMVNPHPETSPSPAASATVNTSDYVLNKSSHIPSTESGELVPHGNTTGVKTGDYVSVNGNNLPSEEVPVNSNNTTGNDDKMINETVVSHDKESNTNEESFIDSSGNTESSGLLVRTNSISDHGKMLKSCTNSSESANNTHSDSANCDVQSASTAVQSDYVSHDSAIIQNNNKTEETVNKEFKDENPLSEDVSVLSKQNDSNCKSHEDKSNNNVTENLNKTAISSNSLTRTLNENDRKIIPNANGYVGLDELQKVSAGQVTIKPVNGYITAEQMQNLHN